MKKLALGLAALAMTAVSAGAQEGLENEKRSAYMNKLEGKRVVYIPMNMNADLTIAWHAFLQRQAEELGYTVDLRDPNWSTEAGARALTSAISEKPDLIVLQNPDVQSYARLIQQAQRQGIKLIQLNMESLTPSDTYVGADWQGIGYAAGQEVAKHCMSDGAPSKKVAITMGVPTAPVDLFQIYGFRQALEEAGGGFEIVSQQAAGYDPSKANSITAAVLQQHPDLCSVFGIWDGMDAGSGAAVKEAGMQDSVYVVTSGGAAQASCEKVADGTYDMYIGYDARMQGAALNVQVSRLLQSDKPAGDDSVVYYTPNYRLTADNLNPGSCWTYESLEN
ncbi:sugar ABC transporter substrate-binding protein [Rhodovulum sp. FJ3]|jgi:ribose transport system substrate-binding protein|uniref:sugar ABC transporter substrate-binding protein n=1 Tax=Rhodovulum sp. FJ3 TaxID=3079053 RepID=UPI00293DFA01|nr:sugar ABC transporter substrate-binding protein [Rhodovulum sp. FJ3]MDV4169193.1 sugar ABC transporter substrate-binding protein [Rhodovulum sp. FJ3]